MDINKGLRYISILMTPVAFVINPLLLLFMVVCQMISYLRCAETMEDKFLLLFLCATTFTGISVFSFKIYDILILSFFVYAVARHDKDLYITSEQILYLFVVFVVSLFHFNNTALLETSRYVFSIMLMILIQSGHIEFGKYQTEILHIMLANLYYAVCVYILTSREWVQNYSGTVISTSIYMEYAEVRLNGFFTDPNKYTVFCFTMLILVKLFFDDSRIKKAAMFILGIAAVISGSRMGLVGIIVFLMFEGFSVFREQNRIVASFLFCGTLLVSAVWIVCPDIFTTILNEGYFLVTEILGREHTLELFKNVSEDGRVVVWRMAASYIAEHPFLGHGWLSYGELLPYLTHNTFLSLLLDGGILMLATYLFFFRKVFWGKNWIIMIPLFFLPVFLLDLSNLRMHYLLLALIQAGQERTQYDTIHCFD